MAAAAQLIDTRAYGKLRSFNGEHNEWVNWSFVARSYLALLHQDLDQLLAASEQANLDDLDFLNFGPQAQQMAMTLYHVLVSCVEGRALLCVRTVPRGNGFLAWRALIAEYQPTIGGRFTSVLMGLLNPNWEKVAVADFLATLTRWELEVDRFQLESGDHISGMMRVAVVTRHAPNEIKTMLRQSSSAIAANYELMKRFVREYVQSGIDYNTLGEPDAPKKDRDAMDVGYVGRFPKGGKGKGKGYDGSPKGGKGGKGHPGGKRRLRWKRASRWKRRSP